MSKVRSYAITFTGFYLVAITVFFAIFVWRSSPSPQHESQSDELRSEFNEAEPKFIGLGSYSRKVTTKSAEAQQYFDQGLAFLFGFNYEESLLSFQAAAESDPDCAMAHWGVAMANGPHINNMVVSWDRAKAAWNAFIQARSLSAKATPVERALIEAVGHRFSSTPPPDRKSLDEAYANAMRDVWKAYPDDPDVGALTAEALIDLHPWNQWTHDGKRRPGTDELLQTLDAVLTKFPMHPLALHLMIHALEASPHPEKADSAADRLRDLMPGVDHLVHMPSHIDVRRGRWQQAVLTNEKAIAAEKAYWRAVPRRTFYHIPMAHNHHMLAFAAMMQGQSQKATDAIQEMLAAMPKDYVKKNASTVDGFFAMPYELHLRFGNWDSMLAEPKPKESFPITTALWHYARGVAFAARKQTHEATEEWKELLLAETGVPQKAVFRKTLASSYLGIAEKMLEGEILYRQGSVPQSIAALREAVRREDRLHYTEPPNWILPVRHALGATLMDAGRYSDAEVVYRQDLAHYPENGWSLYGLARSLRMQGKSAEAAAISARFDKAWEHADVKLSSSCYCLQARD
jgi:tetratricopeptide (TPR) repeat protein